MAEAVSAEQARSQAWEMMLEKAREAHYADPKAAAAAKTLLADSAWKDAIESGVTASLVPESTDKFAVDEDVPWQGVYPGYIDGKLALGPGYEDFDAARTDKEGTFTIEDIKWGFASSK